MNIFDNICGVARESSNIRVFYIYRGMFSETLFIYTSLSYFSFRIHPSVV